MAYDEYRNNETQGFIASVLLSWSIQSADWKWCKISQRWRWLVCRHIKLQISNWHAGQAAVYTEQTFIYCDACMILNEVFNQRWRDEISASFPNIETSTRCPLKVWAMVCVYWWWFVRGGKWMFNTSCETLCRWRGWRFFSIAIYTLTKYLLKNVVYRLSILTWF
jgi:hypothetical protein